MTAKEWKDAIAEFAAEGTLRFGFSGGEALLREDAVEIIAHAKGTGAATSLCSNGILLPERKEVLDFLDLYTTSLDAGTPKIHDRQRGSAGNLEKTLHGIELALETHTQVTTLTVLTKENIHEVPAILALADEMGFQAAFQPCAECSTTTPGAASMAPSPAEIQETVRFLMHAKREGRNVLSSVAALRQLLDYPERHGAKDCRAAGKYFCYVDPTGVVFPCHFLYDVSNATGPCGAEVGYVKAFEKQCENKPTCPGCFIVPYVELNTLFSLRPSALWERVWNAF